MKYLELSTNFNSKKIITLVKLIDEVKSFSCRCKKKKKNTSNNFPPDFTIKVCVITNKFIFTYHEVITLEYGNMRHCYNFLKSMPHEKLLLL